MLIAFIVIIVSSFTEAPEGGTGEERRCFRKICRTPESCGEAGKSAFLRAGKQLRYPFGAAEMFATAHESRSERHGQQRTSDTPDPAPERYRRDDHNRRQR